MAFPTYYTYNDPYPATLNHPNAVQIESKADWPKSYRYNPNHIPFQGIHPPAPVYTANQPAPSSWYYHGGQQPQSGYYVNGQWFQIPAPTGTSHQSPYYYYQPSTSTYFYNWSKLPSPSSSFCDHNHFYKDFFPQFPLGNPYSYLRNLVPGGPSILPMPTCPATMTAQAATAAAANAALAAMPQGPNYFAGGGSMDFAAQQAYLMAQPGVPKPPPTQLAPYKPAAGTQFWCKETDGSWTLRTHSDILMGEVSPGHWERHSTSGYFYWVRQ